MNILDRIDENNATIPGYLNADDTTVDTDVRGKPAGIVDNNSKPGSIAKRDIESSNADRYGRLINDYLENDGDQSTNLKFVMEDGSDLTKVRQFKGNK